MVRKAPLHLNALRAFEASARHLSFSAAAAELHVTPAAVGQLVRTLEQWLGAPLFQRASAGRARLALTPLAELALPDIQSGFDRLSLGVERMKNDSGGTLLTVTVSPAFAAKWLLPRVDRFQSHCSDTDLRLETSLKPVDFAALGVDVGVRYGRGQWADLVAEKLLDEEIYPVCSPALRRRIGSPRDLAREMLIHDLSLESHADFPSWKSWLSKAGVTGIGVARGMKINNSAAVLQAAIEGHGIALGRSVMAREDVRAGRLVRLFPKIDYVSALAYYVVYRQDALPNPRLVAFRDWLFAEARNWSFDEGVPLASQVTVTPTKLAKRSKRKR